MPTSPHRSGSPSRFPISIDSWAVLLALAAALLVRIGVVKTVAW